MFKSRPLNMSYCGLHKIPEEVVTLEDEAHPNEEELEQALDYLTSQGIAPRFGDLIEFEGNSGYRNNGIAIFDGRKIIDLDAEPDDYGTLPQCFRVLEINPTGVRFPIRYWHNLTGEDWRGIEHNYYVWFDHRPYRDQLIDNVRYDNQLFNGKYAVFTHFLLEDGTKVYLVLLYTDQLFNKSPAAWAKFKEGYRLISWGTSGSVYKHPTLPDFTERFSPATEKVLIDEDTGEIAGSIVEGIKQELVKIVQKEELIPFECADFEEFYPDDQVANVLYVRI